MANTIRIKRSATANSPTALLDGELAYSSLSKTLYIGIPGSSLEAVGGAGIFAKLASPAFTGTPTAPTVLSSDNSTAVATTAWVRSQGYGTGAAGITALTGDVTASGPGSSVATLATVATAGTFTKVTINATGLVTLGAQLAAGDITTALGYTPADNATRGQPNGSATLDGAGKLTATQIPASLVGAVVYVSTWNASTNTPALTSGTGTKGQYYKVSVAGTTTLDGINQWSPGDTAIFDGTTWDKIDGIANEVLSVAGRTGVITLANTDISGLGSLATQNSVTVAQGGTGLTAVLTGLVKGNGTVYSAAVADTDYLTPSSILDGGQF